jgi:hypothetical protein
MEVDSQVQGLGNLDLQSRLATFHNVYQQKMADLYKAMGVSQ